MTKRQLTTQIDEELLKDIPKIEHFLDFKDGRALDIARKYELDIREILPIYLRLVKEITKGGGQIEIDPRDDNIVKRLACGTVISYELTKREAFKLPIIEITEILNDNIDKFSKEYGEEIIITKHINGIIKRYSPISIYETYGKYYEKIICLLDRQYIDKEK